MNQLFDKIILINLPSRPDRLHRATEELLRNGITNFMVFPAIEKEDGAEGLFYTMMAIFEKCAEAGYQKVLMLEDDAKFLMQPAFIISECLKYLDERINWDLIHLGPNTQCHFGEWKTRYLLPLSAGLATHAIVYSAAAIKKIIDMDLVWEGIPFDQLLDSKIQSQGYSYCTYPLLATQYDDYSNIEKTNVTYNHIEHKFYKNIAPILHK